MSFNLFLDDERLPKHVTWVELPPVEWVVVRSYAEFIEAIITRGIPNRMSLDNDLHPSHYQLYASMVADGRTRFPYEACSPKTGFHCAQWLVKYCLDRKAKLPEYTIHTLNHVAQADIRYLLEHYDRHTS